MTFPDGNRASISVMQCVDALFSGGEATLRKAVTSDVEQAFRNEVMTTTDPKRYTTRAYIFRIGESNSAACMRCSRVYEKGQKGTVDHMTRPYSAILDEYLATSKRPIQSFNIKRVAVPFHRVHQWYLDDAVAAAGWRAFHDARADFQSLCTACNSRKGSGGYKRKKPMC